MKFMAISLKDYHGNDWKDAVVSCRVVTLKAKTLERAKEHMKSYHPKEAWLLTRCDTTRNIAYAQVSTS